MLNLFQHLVHQALKRVQGDIHLIPDEREILTFEIKTFSHCMYFSKILLAA